MPKYRQILIILKNRQKDKLLAFLYVVFRHVCLKNIPRYASHLSLCLSNKCNLLVELGHPVSWKEDINKSTFSFQSSVTSFHSTCMATSQNLTKLHSFYLSRFQIFTSQKKSYFRTSEDTLFNFASDFLIFLYINLKQSL